VRHVAHWRWGLMSIFIVQLGTPRKAREGLRLGTVRRPPRGVPKADFARLDYYDREMSEPDRSRELDMLAALSHQTNLSLGCYCDDESRCHRSVLREFLTARGADVV
jgi:uncharacterized protein YeaO (DUF488 family)